MSTLGKIVYLSEAQASELFANGSITVDGTTITYSANDLYLTPENAEYVNKSGDTMTGALKAKGLRTYVSDTAGNASLNFGETADSTRVGRITMNTTTSRMEFDEENERYFLPAPTAASVTSYDIVTTNGSYTLSDTLFSPKVTLFDDSYPSIAFATATNPTTDLGSLNYNVSSQRIFFNCYTGSGGAEMFQLPATTHTDSSWNAYDILTTKDKAIQDTWTIRGVNTTAPTLYFSRTSNDDRFAAIYGLTNSSGTTSQFLLRNLHSDSTYTDFYLPEVDRSNTATVGYDIITNKDITQTLPGQLILSKTTDVSGSASSEGALVIGTKTGQHLAFDDNEIMAKASATTVGNLNINYDGGNVIFGINNASYYVQIRSTAAATSATAGALRVSGGIGVGSGIYSNGDIMIQGSTAPMLHLRRSDGTELGGLYGLVSSSRLVLRTWNSTGTYYADYQLPDDSANDGFRAYNILTSKDFKYSSVNQSSGTLVGFVGSGAGVWIVSVYDSADAAKYWIGTINKKSGENPVVTTIANATIGAPWGNTIGTIVFSGATGNYVAQGIKIV